MGAVKLVVCPSSAASFLGALGHLYRAFGVHKKQDTHTVQTPTLKDARQLVLKAHTDLENATKDVQQRLGKATTNGPDGTISAKTSSSLAILVWGLQRLDEILTTYNPALEVDLRTCITIQVENLHATHHLKHQEIPTQLEFARSLGNTIKETLKRSTSWSAFYYTKSTSYYPEAKNSLNFRDIPTMKPLPATEMSLAHVSLMRDWALEHGKAVKQRTVRQDHTKYRPGTLPLNLYQKKLAGQKLQLEQEPSTDNSAAEDEHGDEHDDEHEDEHEEDSEQDNSEYSEESDDDIAVEPRDSDESAGSVQLQFLGRVTRSGRVVKLNQKYV